jgi:hypothetical protein
MKKKKNTKLKNSDEERLHQLEYLQVGWEAKAETAAVRF